jgi:hypothetical protein
MIPTFNGLNLAQPVANIEGTIPQLGGIVETGMNVIQNGRIPTLRMPRQELQEVYQTTKLLHKDDQKEGG